MEDKKMEDKEDKVAGRIFVLILGVALLGIMGGTLLGPVLPALLEPFGVSEGRVGQVLAVYTFSTALSMPFLGPLIDKLGRKQVVIPCLLINGISGLLAASVSSFGILLVIRAFQGVGIAGLMPVAMSLIRDFFEGPQKVKAMGYLSSVLALGMVVAPLIGGGLAMLSWRFSFLFYAVSIPLAAAVFFWLPATGGDKNASLWTYVANYGIIVKNKSFIVLTATVCLVAFLMYAIVTFVPLYLSIDIGASEGVIGVIVALQGLSIALVSAMIKNIATRFGAARPLCFGFSIIALSFFSIPLMSTMWGVAVSLLLFGVGGGCIMPLVHTMITDAVGAEYVGAAISLFNAFNFVGQSASPVILGIVSGRFGLGCVFVTSALVAAAAALAILMAARLLPVSFR